VPIRRWTGDADDRVLYGLVHYLAQIAVARDVRPLLRFGFQLAARAEATLERAWGGCASFASRSHLKALRHAEHGITSKANPRRAKPKGCTCHSLAEHDLVANLRRRAGYDALDLEEWRAEFDSEGSPETSRKRRRKHPASDAAEHAPLAQHINGS